MQKIIFTFVILAFFTLNDALSQNRKILFADTNWQEVVARSKAENKLIFLDAYASWCGPCKWMAANMFTNDSIADYYNKTFVCASFDMEKGEGLALRKMFAVKAYPTLLFINSGEEMIHERVGAPQKVRDYLEMGRLALDPKESLSGYLKRYAEGSNSPQFIHQFLIRLSEAYMPVDPVLKKYFAGKGEKELLTRENWQIINDFLSEMKNPVFEVLLRNRKTYSKISSPDTVNAKISSVYMEAFQQVLRTRNQKLIDSSYLALKEKIASSGFEDGSKVIFLMDLSMNQMRGRTAGYLDLAYEGLDKYFSDDPNMLNSIARSVISLTKEPKYLEKALQWAGKAVSLKRDPSFLDTNASILFRMGKKEEAMSLEKEAVELAKKAGVPAEHFEEAVKAMENYK